jgi:hypothetical protein
MNALQGFLFLIVPVLSAYPAASEPRGHIEGRIVDAVTLQPMPGAEVEVVGHPRRITANAAGVYRMAARFGYEMNDRWFVSSKFRYAAGRAKDRFIVHENVLGDEDQMRYSREVVARNADRVPDFHLLNVRLDYRRRLGPVALVTFLDLENIYNRFNTYEERFSALTGKERAIGFGFLGNAGFKLEF